MNRAATRGETVAPDPLVEHVQHWSDCVANAEARRIEVFATSYVQGIHVVGEGKVARCCDCGAAAYEHPDGRVTAQRPPLEVQP